MGGAQLYPGSIAAPTPQTFGTASSPTHKHSFRVDRTRSSGTEFGHALHPGPYPPDLSRFNLYGASNTDSSRTPSHLACRTRTIWQYRYVPALSGLLPPSPTFPGSGCPQLHSSRCDGPKAEVSHLYTVKSRLV